jgi:uncharacterized protein (TIGR02001 family)
MAAVLSMLAFAALPAMAVPVGASVNAALTSDYVWRGSTQSHGDSAFQVGARLAGASGWYGSAWASNVRFAPGTGADTELDIGIGWAGRAGDDWTLDAGLLQYRYPSADVELDWTEFDATATWKDRCWISAGWSNEALGSGSRGTYALVGAKLPVNDRFRFEAAAGYYALGDVGADGRDDSYAHFLASAVWTIASPAQGPVVEARLTAHATDSRAERLFGDDFAGNRIEAALQASF